jgi:hypothetical protein
MAVLGSAVFFVVAPFTLAGIVPWSMTDWQLQPPFLGLELTRGLGALMILAGVPGLLTHLRDSRCRVWAPPRPSRRPRNLVVTGLSVMCAIQYIVAVVAIILGQGC